MYGLTRATITLIGAGIAGFLFWLSTQIVGDRIDTTGDYWVTVALLAGAGVVIVFSQIVGGWTKWGWPRISGKVLLLAFVPALVVGGWILLKSQPEASWTRGHVASWSGHAGIGGLVNDMKNLWQAIAVALGVLLGVTVETTGPRARPVAAAEPETAAGPAPPPPERTRPEPPPDQPPGRAPV